MWMHTIGTFSLPSLPLLLLLHHLPYHHPYHYQDSHHHQEEQEEVPLGRTPSDLTRRLSANQIKELHQGVTNLGLYEHYSKQTKVIFTFETRYLGSHYCEMLYGDQGGW